jgi:signal transduction histidine kinase
VTGSLYTPVAPGAQPIIRFIATYLIYATILIRTLSWHYAIAPVPPIVLVLLAAYGVVLASESALARRLPGYGRPYLLIQSGLILAILLIAPAEIDFLPMLFLPLAFQAVLFYQRRIGFLWIGAFILARIVPLALDRNLSLDDGVAILLFAGLVWVIGNYAHLTWRAELARQENQHLLGELQGAYRQLQDYAAQVEDFAAMQERSRLARELHDSVTQTLFSMNLTVQAATLLVEKDSSQLAAQFDRLQELARNALGEIQVLASQLRTRSLAEEGLAAALQRLADERHKRDGLQIHLEVSGRLWKKGLSEPVVTGLYRIAQEALNNVARHAGTCEAVLRLNLESQPAYLEVEDSGRGFERDRLVPQLNHMGLAGMEERARELGWQLQVDSQPGRGTRVRVEERLVWEGMPGPSA